MEQRRLLTTILGVGPATAEALIAEIGVDMSQFPSAAHLPSWAGICPGNRESAGKRTSGRPRKGSKWLSKALTESARAAARSKGIYLAAQHARLRGRRGPRKPTGAVRHSILVAAYHPPTPRALPRPRRRLLRATALARALHQATRPTAQSASATGSSSSRSRVVLKPLAEPAA